MATTTSADQQQLFKQIKEDTDKLVAGTDQDLTDYAMGLQNVTYAHVGATGAENDYINILKKSLDTQVTNYNAESQRIMDYSDMYANNSYVQEELRLEMVRSQAFVNALKNSIHKSKLISQENVYQENRLKFWRFLIWFSLLTLLMALALVRLTIRGAFPQVDLLIGIILISMFYIMIVVYMLINNSYRTRLDWTKYYWKQAIPKEQASCTQTNTAVMQPTPVPPPKPAAKPPVKAPAKPPVKAPAPRAAT
jgi:hypothetical protein